MNPKEEVEPGLLVEDIQSSNTAVRATSLTADRNIFEVLKDTQSAMALLRWMKDTDTHVCFHETKESDRDSAQNQLITDKCSVPYGQWVPLTGRNANDATEYASPASVQKALVREIRSIGLTASEAMVLMWKANIEENKFRLFVRFLEDIESGNKSEISVRDLSTIQQVLSRIISLDSRRRLFTAHAKVTNAVENTIIQSWEPGDMIIANNAAVMHRRRASNKRSSDRGKTFIEWHHVDSSRSSIDLLHILYRDKTGNLFRMLRDGLQD